MNVLKPLGTHHKIMQVIPFVGAVELIKMLGDWKSDSVLLYLTAPLNIRLQTINLISRSILTDTEAS